MSKTVSPEEMGIPRVGSIEQRMITGARPMPQDREAVFRGDPEVANLGELQAIRAEPETPEGEPARVLLFLQGDIAQVCLPVPYGVGVDLAQGIYLAAKKACEGKMPRRELFGEWSAAEACDEAPPLRMFLLLSGPEADDPEQAEQVIEQGGRVVLYARCDGLLLRAEMSPGQALDLAAQIKRAHHALSPRDALVDMTVPKMAAEQQIARDRARTRSIESGQLRSHLAPEPAGCAGRLAYQARTPTDREP